MFLWNVCLHTALNDEGSYLKKKKIISKCFEKKKINAGGQVGN